jgi:hypothetical protein
LRGDDNDNDNNDVSKERLRNFVSEQRRQSAVIRGNNYHDDNRNYIRSTVASIAAGVVALTK